MEQAIDRPTAKLTEPGRETIPFREAVKVWTQVAVNSFGGPAGQIAVMQKLIVEDRRWVSETRFLHALNYCMLLPGPEAMQLATYLGWLMHGYKGGLVAGSLFVLPGFLSILALSIVYVLFSGAGVVTGLFFGLKAAVLAVVLQAMIRLGRTVLGNPATILLAVSAFLALFVFDLPFPLVIFVSGGIGMIGVRFRPGWFLARQSGTDNGGAIDAILENSALQHARPSLKRALMVTAISFGFWFTPLALLWLTLGGDHVFTQIGIFFSKVAIMTFGGAYAVLAYIAQEAVHSFGWLAPGQMLDGLGMAETTPGPLVQVVQFVGFLGATKFAGDLPPLLSGVIGAVITTWVTFVPCFFWIFLGGPYVERIRNNKRLSGALTAITASVVGVIANLAVWFGIGVLFGEVGKLALPFGATLPHPTLASLQPAALIFAVAAFVALQFFRVGMIKVLAATAGTGIALHYLTI